MRLPRRFAPRKADVVRSVRPLGVKKADIIYKLGYKQSNDLGYCHQSLNQVYFIVKNVAVGSFYRLFS